MTINQHVTLWSMLPHTHVRGKRWQYQAIYPDGRTETILSVPKYDFDWQTDYIFKQPLKLPKGTKSTRRRGTTTRTNNPSNPDPTKDVWWGDQTWEEMMFTGLTYSLDPPPTPTAAQNERREALPAAGIAGRVAVARRGELTRCGSARVHRRRSPARRHRHSVRRL